MQELLKQFDEKFSPEWWNGFGTTDDINKLGIDSIKDFILSAYTKGIENAKKVVENKAKERSDMASNYVPFIKVIDMERLSDILSSLTTKNK